MPGCPLHDMRGSLQRNLVPVVIRYIGDNLLGGRTSALHTHLRVAVGVLLPWDILATLVAYLCQRRVARTLPSRLFAGRRRNTYPLRCALQRNCHDVGTYG